MSEKQSHRNELVALAQLQVSLEKQGGISANGQLFEQILTAQDSILDSFGLPAVLENQRLIWFSEIPSDLELDFRIKQLHEKASEYLSGDAKPELQLLTEAKENRSDPFEVLPELKIATHAYTLFVYNEILLLGKDSVENVLAALKLANRHEFLNTLGKLIFGGFENVFQAQKSMIALRAVGVRYIDEFIHASLKPDEKTQTPHLLRFLNELNGSGTFSREEDFFESLTSNLMNNLCLAVGKSGYRIVECEIYYRNPSHLDPYVHCGEQQLTAGQLYYNKVGGIDITFGSKNTPAFGGILIRGIRNLKTGEYISKVTEIVGEVFKALGNVILEENRIHLAELGSSPFTYEKPIQSQRIGLTLKENDSDRFIDKPYRYIVELVPAHKFREKEKVVRQLLNDGKINAVGAKDILGYNMKL